MTFFRSREQRMADRHWCEECSDQCDDISPDAFVFWIAVGCAGWVLGMALVGAL